MADAQFRISKYFIEVAILHRFFKQFYCHFKMEKRNQVVKSRSEKKHTIPHCQVMLNT